MKRVIDNLYTRGGGSAQECISELKRVLGLGTAAYTAITAYIGHALATA
ncbi:MAG: hypothetical protein GYA16_01190, partial [Spirochaetes bacterium]|nr:hypothetical protein [Spirochaetota bacterium]